jgi:hypothetical protein
MFNTPNPGINNPRITAHKLGIGVNDNIIPPVLVEITYIMLTLIISVLILANKLTSSKVV